MLHKMSKACSFQLSWLQEPSFASWLVKVPNDVYVARCKLCCKTFSLSNMGRRAVTSHMSSAKHVRSNSAMSESASMRIFLNSSNKCIQQEVAKAVVNEPESTSTTSAESETKEQLSSSTLLENSGGKSSGLVPKAGNNVNYVVSPRGLKTFIVNDSVTKAEILWCIHTVITHKSLRTAGKDISLMTLMFPDSEIAKKVKLQKDKVGYTLVYGISPYFKKELCDKLSKCDYVVVGFDESLNKVSQKQQMDVNVRYWDSECSEVKCRYLTSVFLGRSTANDLLLAFKEAVQFLNQKKILQISMDGPNVNHRFLKDLKDCLKTELEDKEILDLGSCGLHTL